MIVNFVPLSVVVAIEIVPFNDFTVSETTSNPTPLPEIELTSVLVLKLDENNSSASWRFETSDSPIRPFSFARFLTELKLIPRPSSDTTTV